MRISDWNSDVCSSDLARRALVERQVDQPAPALRHAFNHRPIGFSDLARLERGGKAAVRAWISRKQQAAAGVTGQPVYRRWTASNAKAERVQHIRMAVLQWRDRMHGTTPLPLEHTGLANGRGGRGMGTEVL